MREAILVALSLTISSPALGQAHFCQPAVNAALGKYGIAPDRITESDVLGRKLGSDGESVSIGYKFWLRMKDCQKGYLIVDTDLDCNVEQLFTDAPCQIAGVPDC